MSKEITTIAQTQKASALAVMAQRFSVEPAKLLQTLKDTVFKNASDSELMALTIVANEYGLNPLTKEIYAFPAKGGGIVPVVSVDGWLRIINSHPQMDGMDFEFALKESGSLDACTAIIYRKDRSRPIRVTEFLDECKRNTDPWKMEHRMLRHKALIQCARVAFGFSGIYDEDEAESIKQASGSVVSTKINKPLFKAPEETVATQEVPVDIVEAVKEPKSKKSEKDAKQPEHATKVAGLRNLMQASGVTEEQVLAYILKETGEPYASIEEAGESLAGSLITAWPGIIDEVKGGN